MATRFPLPLLPLAILLSASLASGQESPSIARSFAHDFSDAPWCDADPCTVCHFEDGPYAGSASVPIWSHLLTGREGYMPFFTLRGNPAGVPTSSSALCMGCHDGTTPLNAFDGNEYRGPDVVMPSPTASFGRDLREHHPVSLTLPRDVAYNANSPLARNGRVECISCHDPHGTNGIEHLLVMADDGEGICLSCHNK